MAGCRSLGLDFSVFSHPLSGGVSKSTTRTEPIYIKTSQMVGWKETPVFPQGWLARLLSYLVDMAGSRRQDCRRIGLT